MLKLALHDFLLTLLVESRPCFDLFLVENLMHCRHLSARSLITQHNINVQRPADHADTTRWQHQIKTVTLYQHKHEISHSITLSHRKSAAFRKSRGTIQSIPRISMNMRGGPVTVNHWISWLSATLAITWTSCRTSGQSSTLWVGCVNSQWCAETSSFERGWWFEALYRSTFLQCLFSWAAKGFQGFFLCCEFYYFIFCGDSARGHCCS